MVKIKGLTKSSREQDFRPGKFPGMVAARHESVGLSRCQVPGAAPYVVAFVGNRHWRKDRLFKVQNSMPAVATCASFSMMRVGAVAFFVCATR